MVDDRPTEEQIREALAVLVFDVRSRARADAMRTARILARLGAQQIRRETAEITHWPGCWREHHECAVVMVEEARAALTSVHLEGAWNDRAHSLLALLARIDPET